MSYNNFIPTVWSAAIQRDFERACTAVKLSWREFEGEIKEFGDTVKVQGVGRPNLGTYTKNSTSITPENLNDVSTNLVINQSKYYAFEIDDIDKRQAKGNLMDAQMAEAAAAIAEDADDYIYALYGDAGSTVTAASMTSATAFSTVTSAMKVLWGNKVPKNTEVSLEVSPAFYEKILLADIVKNTNNPSIIASGAVGEIAGAKVYLANGVYNDGTYDYCFLRTKKAIAYADQINKTEAYRPESAFSDAVKGLHLYGAKVIRPKELVVIKFSAGSETTI